MNINDIYEQIKPDTRVIEYLRHMKTHPNRYYGYWMTVAHMYIENEYFNHLTYWN